MRVRIYRPSLGATQAGQAKSRAWVIEPVLTTARTPDPLMGWARGGDSLASLYGRLQFETPDEAVSFANRRGWAFFVEEPAEKKVKPHSYIDNFLAQKPKNSERN